MLSVHKITKPMVVVNLRKINSLPTNLDAKWTLLRIDKYTRSTKCIVENVCNKTLVLTI